jgi:ribonuclease HII
MRRTPDPAKSPTLKYEQYLWKAGYTRIAGVDEAGRGAWAGPVCAAAVILPVAPAILQTLKDVRDSKLMTPLSRETWAPRIREAATAWAVGFASAQEIDAIGILPATKLAAMRALNALSPSRLPPDYLLTDYLIFPNSDLPQTGLIKGDRLSLSVAAASVLAKTARDAWMREMNGVYPGYGFARHKGYGTRIHQEAIRCLGLCAIHRKSFAIKDE